MVKGIITMDVIVGIAAALLPLGGFIWFVTLPIVCRLYGANLYWKVAVAYGCAWSAALITLFVVSGAIARSWCAGSPSFAARWGEFAKPSGRGFASFVAVIASLSAAMVSALQLKWTLTNLFLVPVSVLLFRRLLFANRQAAERVERTAPVA